MTMKKKSAISTMATAAGALAAMSIYASKIQFFHQEAALGFRNEEDTGAAAKFEPRFDGLRFIETLVTAHR